MIMMMMITTHVLIGHDIMTSQARGRKNGSLAFFKAKYISDSSF